MKATRSYAFACITAKTSAWSYAFTHYDKLLCVLANAANALFCRAHEARRDRQHFRAILVCSHSKQGESKVVVFISRDGLLVSNSNGKDTPAQADEIHNLQPAALYPTFGT